MARQRFRASQNKKSSNLTRKRRRTRRRRRSAGAGKVISIPIPISILTGAKEKITVKHISDYIPKHTPFRLKYVHLTLTGMYTTASKNTYGRDDGFFFPGLARLSLYDTESVIVVDSSPVLLCNIPRNVRVHLPRQVESYPIDIAETTPLCLIEAACLGKPSESDVPLKTSCMKGMAYVVVQLGTPLVKLSGCTSLNDFVNQALDESPSEFEILSPLSSISKQLNNI